MRPSSIIAFERVYLASLALGIVNTAVNWREMIVALEDPALQVFGGRPSWMIGTIALSLAISLLLWFFIARRGSTIAKWIYVVFTAFGLIGIVSTVAMLPFGTQMVLNVVGQLLQFFAAWLLFKPDAKAWFDGRWTVDARTFD